MLFCFRDPGAERAFRLHYAGSGTRHALGATSGVLLLLLQLAMAAVGYSAAPALEVFLKLAWVAEFYVWYVPLGKEQFILCLGPYTVWKRLLATCYFWQLAKVVGPTLPVQKHLFVLHCCFALARPVSLWYWGGSALCWLAVVVIDSLGGGAGRAGVLRRMLQAASGSSSMSFFLFMLLPGLALSCFELRARRVWLARHHFAGQSHAAAAEAAAATAAAAGSPAVAKQHDIELLDEERELVKPACSASSSSSSQAAAAPLTDAAPCALTHALPPAGVAAGDSAPPAAAGSDVGSAFKAPPSAVWQGMLPSRPLYRSPVSRHTVSFKFTQAPELDNEGRFQVRLAEAEAMQTAALASLASHSSSQQHAAVAADVAAFPGCWQLVLQLVLPAGQEALLQRQLLQQAAEQVLGSWPECSLQGMQLLPHPSAAVGGSARHDSTAAHAAAESLYLKPVVLNLSDDGSISLAGSAAAALWLPPAVVQQLVSAGRRSVRVVVTPAELPAGQLLLDLAWQLPVATTRGTPDAPSEGASAAPPPTPAAVELQLPLPLGSVAGRLTAPVTAAARVLSVTVLADGDAGPTTRTPTAAAVPAAAGKAAGVSKAAQQPASGAHDAAHHVLAKLPLLVLPSAAAGELQQQYAELVAEGTSCGTAYQQLLPLLQDLAGVLVHAAAAAIVHPSPARPADDSSSSSSSSSSSLMREVVTELAAYFTSHGMAGCLQLLLDVTAAQPAAAAAGPDATCTTGCVAGFTEADTGLHRQPTQAGTAAAAAAAAAINTSVSSSQAGVPLDNFAASSGCAPSAGSVMKPAGSMHAAAGASGCGNGVDKQQASNESSSSSSHSTFIDSSKGAAYAAADAAPSHHSFDANAFPASAFHISGWTLLFGFPEAAVDAAYRCYKTCMLPVQCLSFLIVYAATTCVGMVQVVRLLARGSEGMPDYRVQVCAAVFRLLWAAMCAAAHAVVWAAGMSRPVLRQASWLRAVRQHSGVVLSAGILIPPLVLAVNALTGGVWAAAYAATNAAMVNSPWVMCMYRHVVEPLAVRAGMLMTAFTVAAQLVLFDPLFTRPRLLGLGPDATALLLCGVHLGVAAWLDLGMRRRFVLRAGRAREV